MLKELTNTSTSGSTIVDMQNIADSVFTISSHGANCGGSCILEDTKCCAGLAVTLIVKCNKCQQQFKINLSNKVKKTTKVCGM